MKASSYLRVRNWKNYQNADVFKKSHGKPPWIKFYVSTLDDYELRRLPYVTQLLFDRLLLVAAKTSGAIPNDSEWLAAQTGIDAQEIANSLPLLLKGRWLSQTKTPRRSRETREPVAKVSPLEVEEEEKRKELAASNVLLGTFRAVGE